MTTAPKYDLEPRWKKLNLRTLTAAAQEVLSHPPTKRIMKSAYAEVYAWLVNESGRSLDFTCHTCNSLIDSEMKKCWACGLVFSDDAAEEPMVDSELTVRAVKLGVQTKDRDRAEIIKDIEAAETKARQTRRDVDLLVIEAGKLNERLTETMPDGWSKRRGKQYTSYFDPVRVRRIAVFHRGLKILFSLKDGFLDGFPDVEFYDEEERKRRHYGRVNYQYMGDMAKQVVDLSRRIFSAKDLEG